MNKAKKFIAVFLDILEVYIPSISLIVMFVCFLLQIFSRYILGSQFHWTYEMTLTGFLWCLLMAAPYAQRKQTHVRFELISDILPRTGQFIFRCISNIFIIFCFGLLVWHGTSWVDFMSISKSSTLRIPLNIVYSPFIFFTTLTTIHTIVNLIQDIRKFFRKGES